VHTTDVGSFYEAGLRVLAFVEGRRATGRRFGADADARWSAFRGALSASDRIDLLLRDADAEWPGALGGRAVFDIAGLADDEAFGPGWPSLDPVDAEEIWRRHRTAAAPASVEEALAAIAAAWGLRLEPVVCRVAATDRVVVAGPSAIASTVLQFEAAASELDWCRQVMVVATPPGHRQLATAAPALLNLAGPTRLFSAAAAPELELDRANVITSSDAHPDDLARAGGARRA
jgi:hypothetical protein